jgi:hypothetical protein
MIKNKTFKKLSPEGQRAILNMERRLKENKEEQKFLEKMLKRFT